MALSRLIGSHPARLSDRPPHPAEDFPESRLPGLSPDQFSEINVRRQLASSQFGGRSAGTRLSQFPKTPLSTKNPDIVGVAIAIMNRTEFLHRLVLNTICDDFENVDQVILREVAEQGATCGLTIRRADVVEALRGLVEAGLAKAYDLPGSSADPFSGELAGMPPLDVAEEHFRTYFYITKKGMEFHEADGAWWPFGDDGGLRPDWNPPGR